MLYRRQRVRARGRQPSLRFKRGGGDRRACIPRRTNKIHENCANFRGNAFSLRAGRGFRLCATTRNGRTGEGDRKSTYSGRLNHAIQFTFGGERIFRHRLCRGRRPHLAHHDHGARIRALRGGQNFQIQDQRVCDRLRPRALQTYQKERRDLFGARASARRLLRVRGRGRG